MVGRMTKTLRFASLMALAALQAACGSIPPQRPSRPEQRPPISAVVRPADAQCLARLGATGAGYTPLPDRYYGGGCSTLGAVRLRDLAGDRGDFALTNLGPVTCRTAETLAGWARYGVDRAARQILGSPLVRIETMGSYSCRVVAGSTRLSAHATAQAIDIGAFDLADGRRISVKDDWASADPKVREFLRIVHRSACKRFGTVLGPDYNSAHQNHFHLEVTGKAFCR